MDKDKLFEKSQRTLELPIILEMLAGEAVSELAKQNARQLSPSCDFNTVKTRIDETTVALKMVNEKGNPPFSGVIDIRGAVKRADMGGSLNCAELLRIAGLLRAASAAISYYGNGNEYRTIIDNLFLSIAPNHSLETRISSAIISEDELADSASGELSTIRRHMRIAGDKVRQSLNKIITSPAYAKVLQEPIITMRNDRYVVPVKAEHKASVPGLVHDISSSGATLFIEPMAAVQLNNEIRELMAKEKQEIERILSELSAEVADNSDDLVNGFMLLTELDLIFAKAKLSVKQNAVESGLSQGGLSSVILRGARHPLLPRGETVPIDIRLGDGIDTMVVTGPNTGGKTVALKTLGLLCLMTQCGMHIPALHGSTVPVFENILADIGDEQSIEQSLSTFSSHMTNIVGILDICNDGSLLLLDELGAGTDPVEGAALATAIIEYARRRGALIAATTHYAELKTYAVNSPGVVNASCEFDVESLRPTYRLITGVPGKSNAFAISKRLGLPDAVIEDAESRISTENADFEDALLHLEEMRLKLESDRDETSRRLREAQEEHRRAEELRKKTEVVRDNAALTAKREAERILDDARKTTESIMADLSDMQRKAARDADWQKLNEDKAMLFRRLNEAEDSVGSTVVVEASQAPPHKYVPGDKVSLKGIGTLADVIEVGADGVISLQAGIMKITAKESDLIFIKPEDSPEVKKQLIKADTQLRQLEAKPEIDLRGMQTDEAIPLLERFLDNARRANLNTITVIHGKGTGALRQAVQQALRREQKGIKSFRLGRYGEGEDGVTIVELQ